MNINTSDLNFNGRYLLRGKVDQVNRAVATISQVKGDKVEFLPITTCLLNTISVAISSANYTLPSQ